MPKPKKSPGDPLSIELTERQRTELRRFSANPNGSVRLGSEGRRPCDSDDSAPDSLTEPSVPAGQGQAQSPKVQAR